jgi:hypothetical protein
MLSIIGIKKTIKQHTADMEITHIGQIPLYTISVEIDCELGGIIYSF